MTAIAVGHLPLLQLLYIAPSLDLACWPYLVLGAIFHLGYQYYLVESYKKVIFLKSSNCKSLCTIISYMYALFLNVNLIFSDYLGIVIIALGLIVSSGIYRLKSLLSRGSAQLLGYLYLLILFLTDTVEELGIVLSPFMLGLQ